MAPTGGFSRVMLLKCHPIKVNMATLRSEFGAVGETKKLTLSGAVFADFEAVSGRIYQYQGRISNHALTSEMPLRAYLQNLVGCSATALSDSLLGILLALALEGTLFLLRW